ncbi:UNVERIFIED_CONTAM: hypothetical protein K2H54_002075 [Gekko kuhli]
MPDISLELSGTWLLLYPPSGRSLNRSLFPPLPSLDVDPVVTGRPRFRGRCVVRLWRAALNRRNLSCHRHRGLDVASLFQPGRPEWAPWAYLATGACSPEAADPPSQTATRGRAPAQGPSGGTTGGSCPYATTGDEGDGGDAASIGQRRRQHHLQRSLHIDRRRELGRSLEGDPRPRKRDQRPEDHPADTGGDVPRQERRRRPGRPPRPKSPSPGGQAPGGRGGGDGRHARGGGAGPEGRGDEEIAGTAAGGGDCPPGGGAPGEGSVPQGHDSDPVQQWRATLRQASIEGPVRKILDRTAERTMAGHQQLLRPEAEPFRPRAQQRPPLATADGQGAPTKPTQPPTAQQPVPNDPPGIQVVIWRVDGLGGGARQRNILEALAALRADVVLLHDTRLVRDADLRAAERQWCRWGPSLCTDPPSSRGGPRDRARQRQDAAILLQQLRHVLAPGTARGMHFVAETRTAGGGGSRALVTTRADAGHGRGTEPAHITQLAAADQGCQPGAGDDRQRLEAVLRGAQLADVTDLDGYGGRPGAVPRLERFPPLGRPAQHITDAATATVPDDPWRCPMTLYSECGSMHRARGMRLWTEEGNAVGEHWVLQTPFVPHLLCTLVIRPEPARWAARPPRWRLQWCILAGARTIARLLACCLATQEAAGDEGTEADSDTGGEARNSSGVQPRPDPPSPGATAGRPQGTRTTWAAWWQANKAAVACRCRDLKQEAARRGRQRYQAALRRTLAAEDILACGGHVNLNRWRRDVAVVRQEERHRREQCRRKQVLRARGAPVTRLQWWRAVQRDAVAPEPMVHLHRPVGTWAMHPREITEVMGEAFAQLVDITADAEAAGGCPPPDAEEAANLRAIDLEEHQRRAAWAPATADAWASRA